MELLLWLFVIQVAIVMACVKFHKMRRTKQMTWYIIFRAWHVHGCLNLETLDAVEVDCIMDALIYAKQRYRLEAYESFKAEACLTMGDVNRAKAIARQHDLDDSVPDWTPADLEEWLSMPVYSGGDQD